MRMSSLSDAGRVMIGLHVVAFWPSMRGGFQQVLMAPESQDALSLFTLASEVETSQKLLWLHAVFCPDIIDDDHQSIYTSIG